MTEGMHVSTYPDQDTLVLEVDIGDVELVRKRHCRQDSVSVMSAGLQLWRTVHAAVPRQLKTVEAKKRQSRRGRGGNTTKEK